MIWSHARLKTAGLRAVVACGLVGVLAVQAGPSAAQTGASTPPNCQIQLSVANPTPGDLEVPRSLQMSGTAVDDTAASGTGISGVEVFLGNRDQGGLFLGSTATTTGALGTWSVTTSFPANISGGQDLFVYGTSSVSGQQAFVSIPFVLAQSTGTPGVSDQP